VLAQACAFTSLFPISMSVMAMLRQQPGTRVHVILWTSSVTMEFRRGGYLVIEGRGGSCTAVDDVFPWAGPLTALAFELVIGNTEAPSLSDNRSPDMCAWYCRKSSAAISEGRDTRLEHNIASHCNQWSTGPATTPTNRH
jgi:hypothetical protein